ncbi:non-specific lipid-transfer protein-like [Corylus avellana]|uniref:non-specific lipid-transfer protein-like n=1 Tax=Corylus avellana TaxID=13451 RepID=UPI00286AC205|nr:non-specific lipid-transfer protein-like [Corylus avellana]
MEKKMMGCAVWAFGLMFLVLNASGSPSNDISCKDAITTLIPCQPFLVGSDPASPTAACCLGAQNVVKQATTPEARKALCECFKKSGKDMGVKPEKVKQIPDLCKIDVPVPIDPDVDCSKIQ